MVPWRAFVFVTCESVGDNVSVGATHQRDEQIGKEGDVYGR